MFANKIHVIAISVIKLRIRLNYAFAFAVGGPRLTPTISVPPWIFEAIHSFLATWLALI
jgi:hypothetical protein